MPWRLTLYSPCAVELVACYIIALDHSPFTSTARLVKPIILLYCSRLLRISLHSFAWYRLRQLLTYSPSWTRSRPKSETNGQSNRIYRRLLHSNRKHKLKTVTIFTRLFAVQPLFVSAVVQLGTEVTVRFALCWI